MKERVLGAFIVIGICAYILAGLRIPPEERGRSGLTLSEMQALAEEYKNADQDLE